MVDKDAFAWYKQIKTLVTDWDSLIKRLKKDFLPSYADDDIWEEIKARKQKSSESITIFVANLEILFNHLTSVLSVISRVNYIKNNLLPEYISQLALQEIPTVDHLTILCRRLEEASYFTSKNSQVFPIGSRHNPQYTFRNNYNNERTLRNVNSSCGQNSANKNFFRIKSHQNLQFAHRNNYNQNTPRNRNSSHAQDSTNKFFSWINQNQSIQKSKVTCFNCNREGHDYNSCRGHYFVSNVVNKAVGLQIAKIVLLLIAIPIEGKFLLFLLISLWIIDHILVPKFLIVRYVPYLIPVLILQ